MSGHIHAELMAQYAEDARETSRPWERWEISDCEDRWEQCSCHPWWSSSRQYRRKPRTITINGREVPEPMRKAPEMHSAYYKVSINHTSLYSHEHWAQDSSDVIWLKRGLVHSTKESAIAHAQALLSFTEAK